jgi:hypothetical protein
MPLDRDHVAIDRAAGAKIVALLPGKAAAHGVKARDNPLHQAAALQH